MTESNDGQGHAEGGSALAWGTTSFEPGEHVGLVSRRTIALIAGDNPSTRERLWALVSADTSVDDILEELSSTGIKSLPDFALAQVEGDGLRVVARGAAAVSVEVSTGPAQSIDASDVRTWVEDAVDDVLSVTMSINAAGDASDSGFAVLAGSVPAALLTRRFDEADAHAVAGEQWTAAPRTTPEAASAPAAGAASQPDPDPIVEAPAEPVAEPETEADPLPHGAAELVDDTDQAEPDLAEAPEVELEPVDDNSGAGEMTNVEPATGSLAAIDTDDVYDVPSFVAGGSSAASTDDDPVLATDLAPEHARDLPADTAAVWGDDVDASDSAEADIDVDSSAAYPQPPPPASGATPGAGGPPPYVAPIDSPAGAEFHAGAPAPAPTADDSAAAVPFDAAADLESSLMSDDGREPARRSVDSPFNLADIDAELEIVGVLAFSNGERIEIDRSVLVGRNPKVAGDVDGPLPYIMKYEGPGQGLSRTHAEIRIEDGALVLEDLRSTNGTDVQPPGEPRRRLVGGEPEVIVPGTLIDFGDELRCMVEAPS